MAFGLVCWFNGYIFSLCLLPGTTVKDPHPGPHPPQAVPWSPATHILFPTTQGGAQVSEVCRNLST